MKNTEAVAAEAVRARPGIDATALITAGAVSGGLSLVITVFLSAIYLGSPWFLVRVAASLLLGPDVIPLSIEAGVLVVGTGIVVHMALALLFNAIIAVVIHRWGLIVGFVGGGLVGLALYYISVYSLTLAFPWVFPLRNWIMLSGYVAYGALAGTVYELLDENDQALF